MARRVNIIFGDSSAYPPSVINERERERCRQQQEQLKTAVEPLERREALLVRRRVNTRGNRKGYCLSTNTGKVTHWG